MSYQFFTIFTSDPPPTTPTTAPTTLPPEQLLESVVPSHNTIKIQYRQNGMPSYLLVKVCYVADDTCSERELAIAADSRSYNFTLAQLGSIKVTIFGLFGFDKRRGLESNWITTDLCE